MCCSYNSAAQWGQRGFLWGQPSYYLKSFYNHHQCQFWWGTDNKADRRYLGLQGRTFTAVRGQKGIAGGSPLDGGAVGLYGKGKKCRRFGNAGWGYPVSARVDHLWAQGSVRLFQACQCTAGRWRRTGCLFTAGTGSNLRWHLIREWSGGAGIGDRQVWREGYGTLGWSQHASLWQSGDHKGQHRRG